ncbi:MAG: RimK family alpha-L-glutamate ligase [Pseudomonadota bacterium]
MQEKAIAIITDDPGWHGRQLIDELAVRDFDARYVRLQDCHFELNQHTAQIKIPGFKQLPAGVFVRGVPGGSLEEVVYYLDVLHGFEATGIKVVNNVRAIERSVDKGMTSFLLKLQNVPTPNSFYSSDLHYINKKLREGIAQGKQYVLKPVFGSQGKGVQKVSCQQDIVDYSEMHGVIYAQEFVDAGYDVGVDYRVFIVSGNVVSCMKRTGEDWITNVAQGGQVEAAKLDEAVLEMSVNSVKALNLEYAGVDLIRDKHGQFWVTEVNSVPAWKGLQATTEEKIVDHIVDDFLRKCGLVN